MAQPRMTEAYHTNRDNLIKALGKWWASMDDVNRLGATLFRSLAEQFAQQAGVIEGEVFERCPKCSAPLPPDGACENRKCGELPAREGGAKEISN